MGIGRCHSTDEEIQMIKDQGVYIAHSTKEDVLCTLNFAPGKTVYGEKKISVDIPVLVWRGGDA